MKFLCWWFGHIWADVSDYETVCLRCGKNHTTTRITKTTIL